ncbi:MAG TPA: RNA polymerase sigma factor [Roseimicrobium sp.]|nr:RNA polymerase sigma factor [Roseimicrobium sp.]
MAENGLDVAACLERVRKGDQDAARDLVENLYPLVLKIVRAHLPRRVAEEDLAQDVFMKMFTHLDQFRGAVPFAHWVSRIAVTTCLDQLRAQKRRPELRWADLSENEAEMLDVVLHNENVPHPSEGALAKELANRLLEMLSPEDRIVITLLDMEQRSVAEIQELTGWNASVIKVRAFRARRKLRKHLENLEKGKK